MSSSQPSRRGQRFPSWAVVGLLFACAATLRELAFAKNRTRFPIIVPSSTRHDSDR